jgi:hypothetical protein
MGAIDYMKIAVAHACADHPYQPCAGANLWNRPIFDRQRLAALAQNGSLHR